MTTKRKTTNKYQRYTCAQLVPFIKKWQKKHASLAKTASWKTTNGWTPKQQRAYIAAELKKAAIALRVVTLVQADLKLKALKYDIARQLGVTFNSSKVTSPAIKRLKSTRSQISKCVTVPGIVSKCSSFKVESFKNPTYVGFSTGTLGSSTMSAAYSKQTKTLKKEIQKLKQRNTFMKSQVAKFRREVAQMQRHYGTLSTQTPSWSVVNGKKVNQDVSNIVRFSNALNNAILKQRKVG